MIRPLPLTLKAYPLATLFIINSECLRAFHGMFEGIPRNFWQNFLDGLATFRGMFDEILQNVSRHFPGCLRTFLGIFGNIPWNVWQRSPEYLARISGIFGNNPRNITLPQFPGPLFRSPFLFS